MKQAEFTRYYWDGDEVISLLLDSIRVNASEVKASLSVAGNQIIIDVEPKPELPL